MKAIRIHSHGGPEQLRVEDIEAPEIKPNEILLRVHAASLNHLDLWVRKGIPGMPLPLPLILGSDGAGVVEKVGAFVKGVREGDEVVVHPGFGCGACPSCLAGREQYCLDYKIYGEHCNGTQAQFVALPVSAVVPKPKNLTFEEAASIPLVFLTAWEMLVNKCSVAPNHTVLVLGASSGIGTAAIQIAKAHGAVVIAATGTQEKADKAKRLGANAVVNYREQDFSKEVKTITNGRGVDIVVEHVGAATWERSLRALAKGGKLVTCGATTGPQVNVDLRFLYYKQQTILGSTMGNRSDQFKILSLFERGVFHPVVDRVFDFSEIKSAHEHLESGQHFGKVVIRF